MFDYSIARVPTMSTVFIKKRNAAEAAFLLFLLL